jgi:uncharacterized protein YaaR (DUF327 family)
MNIKTRKQLMTLRELRKEQLELLTKMLTPLKDDIISINETLKGKRNIETCIHFSQIVTDYVRREYGKKRK